MVFYGSFQVGLSDQSATRLGSQADGQLCGASRPRRTLGTWNLPENLGTQTRRCGRSGFPNQL